MKIEIMEFKKMFVENVEEYDYKAKEVIETHSSDIFYGIAEYVISNVVVSNENHEEVELWVVSLSNNYEIVRGLKKYNEMVVSLCGNTSATPPFYEHEVLAVYDNFNEANSCFEQLDCRNLYEQIAEICVDRGEE